MAENRVFIPQAALDEWLSEDRISIDGEVMTLQPEQRRFRLQTAVHFLAEVAGTPDTRGLVGKVKDLSQLESLGAEHCSDSVILGDNAYQVVEGFAGEPIYEEVAEPKAGNAAVMSMSLSGGSLADAMGAAVGEKGPPSSELDVLARFFLQSR